MISYVMMQCYVLCDSEELRIELCDTPSLSELSYSPTNEKIGFFSHEDVVRRQSS